MALPIGTDRHRTGGGGKIEGIGCTTTGGGAVAADAAANPACAMARRFA